ncbi:MAG: hypothetical protein AB8B87_12065 [Granulosicoccus sp.]
MDEQRSQLFVKHKFQKTMILEVLLITFIMINLLVLAGFVLLDHVPNLHQHKEYIGLAIAGFEVIGFIFVYRYNRRASHRIAGPLFSLQRKLKSIETGDIGFTMEVRQDDQFHELCDQMNKTVNSLRERVTRFRQLAIAVKQQPGNQQVVDDLIREIEIFAIHDDEPADEGRKAA